MILRTRTGGTFLYFFLILLAAATGILTRKAPDLFPGFIAVYGGDTLWSFALYYLISLIWYRGTILQRSLLTLAISVAVEFSQLYHAPWIDSLRNTLPGGLILGFGFVPSDLWCYLAGTILAAGLEGLFVRKI